MPQPSASLAAAGQKLGYGDPDRDACLAVVAVWPVNELTASAKSLVHQLSICLGLKQATWHCHLGPGNSAGHVAAWVRGRGIKLNGFRREGGAVRHSVLTVGK
jgi:hypothetical protein